MGDQLQFDLAVQSIPGFISKRCRIVDNCDTNRHIFVDGVAAYIYRTGDKVQQRNVIVSLLRANLATEFELSRAFGVGLRSVSRWNCIYNQDGVKGLIDKKRCGAPEKVNAQLKAQIRELRAGRVKANEIARLLNIGTGSVCRVLYTESEEQQTAVTFFEVDDGKVDSEIEDAALPTAAQTADASRTVSPEVASDSRMPVSGDPLDRTADRLMARIGLLDDAAPLFLEGQRIEFAGVLLSYECLLWQASDRFDPQWPIAQSRSRMHRLLGEHAGRQTVLCHRHRFQRRHDSGTI